MVIRPNVVIRGDFQSRPETLNHNQLQIKNLNEQDDEK